MQKHIITIAIIFFFSKSMLGQNTYFVDTNNGNDSNVGLSIDQAFKQIQHASQLAKPGDSIKVLPGVYREENESPWSEIAILSSGSEDNYIYYLGIADAQGNRPKVVSSSIKGIDVSSVSYVSIENFELEPYNVDVKDIINNPDFGLELWRRRRAIGIDNGSHHIILKNNYVHDFPGNGIAVGACEMVIIEDNIVEHCAYETNNANSGISLYHVANLNLTKFPDYPNHNIIIKNNISRYNVNLRGFVVFGNQVTDGNGIIIDDFDQDQGTQNIPYEGNVLIIGNQCYGNGGQGINVFSSSNVDIYNNTLFDNGLTTRIENPPYEIAVGDTQLAIGRAKNINVKNNILYNGNATTSTITRYQESNITYENNIHWNTNGTITDVNSNDLIVDPELNSLIGLTNSETILLATMSNPYDENSSSAKLREPTKNNNFPLQNMSPLSGSPTIAAGVSIGVNNINYIGALKFNGEVDPVIEDEIISIETPDRVSPGDTVEVKVQYSASTQRDIQVNFQSNGDPDFANYGISKTSVNRGTGSLTFEVDISQDTPIADDKYQFQVYITETGQGWLERKSNLSKNNIDCVDDTVINGDNTITLGAEGTCGGEKMQLLLNNVMVEEWTVTSDISYYNYNNYNGTDAIKVAFVNDENSNGCDFNLRLDWIQVCDVLYQTEDSSSRTGCGDQDFLFCNGSFDFENISCSSNVRASKVFNTTANTTINTELSISPNPVSDGVFKINSLSSTKSEALYTVRINDLSGREVLSKQNVTSGQNIQTDSNLKGLYLLTVIDQNDSKNPRTFKILMR